MEDLFKGCISESLYKIIASDPLKNNTEYTKIVFNKMDGYFLSEKYTQKQVFHEHVKFDMLSQALNLLAENTFKQFNLWDDKYEYSLRISKSGKALFKKSAIKSSPQPMNTHNRQKKYLIEEGTIVEPLIDMGIFTREGKVVRTMYDKFRQINRFTELLNDELDKLDLTKQLTIIDFGCGKSYLTFIIYYFLVNVRGLNVNIIGLDLKETVIDNCNKAAKKYGYDNLHFELGDINGYHADKPIDIVISLHACDTATDYALYNAVNWQTKLILSVPCCQHELNAQMQSESLAALTRYGIVKERVAALVTDAIRGNILTYCGYSTQLLEFVDMAHTPKNILIRAVKANIPNKEKTKALNEVHSLIKELNVTPTLYRLLVQKNDE
ncbi:MAG: SAM-dependent methyltransferase [Oscillospiraceae bacterium]